MKGTWSEINNYVFLLVLPSLVLLCFIAIYADPKTARDDFLLSMLGNFLIGMVILGLGLFIIGRTKKA